MTFDDRVAQGFGLRGGFIDQFIQIDATLTTWLVLLSGIPQDRVPILSRFFQRMNFPSKCDLMLHLLEILDGISERDLEEARALRLDLKKQNDLRIRLAHAPMVHSGLPGHDDRVFLFGQSGDLAAEEITFDDLNARWAELIRVMHRLAALRQRLGPG